MDIIKRSSEEKLIRNILSHYKRRTDKWKTTKTVCVVKGLAGSGKTTFLLNHFKGNIFYFSFAGLAENVAERLFADYVSEKTDKKTSSWQNSLTIISKKYKHIIFDDLSSVLSSEYFCKAFYDCMITDINTRPFVILITEPTDNIDGLADKFYEITIGYFSVSDVAKLYPKLPKYDVLGLCTISGGIPKIFKEYDCQISFENNMRNMLVPSSAFINFMPELLSKYFRKPEGYHYILYAIANGNHSVSEIGKFTGLAYNKCDNYISALVSHGFIKTEKTKSKRGAEKTAYRLANNYFRLWYLYVYQNYTKIKLGSEELISNIIKSIVDKEIHEFHLQKAFAFANERIFWDLWSNFRITEKAVYAPQTISKGDFSYTFDAILRKTDKAVFIKVFADPLESCRQGELENIREAVMLANVYYDSHVYIFSKRRFTDSALAEAAQDTCISLVGVDKLKF